VASRRSFTPEKTADRAMKFSPLLLASKRASVVFPVPGAPHKINDGKAPPPASSLRRMRPSPTRCVWPTNSANERGRMRSARGVPWSGGVSSSASLNRLLEFHRSIAQKKEYNYRRKKLNTRPAGSSDATLIPKKGFNKRNFFG